MKTQTKLDILRAAKSSNKTRPRISSISRKYEAAYLKELLAISKDCQKEGEQVLDITIASNRFIGDVSVGDAPAFLTAMKSVVFGGTKRKVKGVANAIASKFVRGQAKATEAELALQLKNMTGADVMKLIKKEKLDTVISNSITANVALINSIPVQYHERLERLVLVAVQNNKPQSWLEHQIKRLGKSTDARAKLIARDQVGSVNAAVNQARQRKIGLEAYIWRTCKDERVRPEHRKREGKVIPWDSPPEDGHAGEPIGCRCHAEAYLG